MKPFDPTKAKARLSYPHPGTLYGLAADHAARRLYAGGDDYGVHVYDLADAARKEAAARWAGHDNYVAALAVVARPARKLVVSASYDRHLVWWDAEKGQPVWSVEAHQGWVRNLAPTPDGGRLVSVGDDMLVKVWEAATGRLLRTFAGHDRRTPQGHVTALYAVTVSPNGRHVASADRAGEVRVWELDTGVLCQRFQVPTLYTYDERQRKRSIGGIRALAFAADGNHLAVGGIGQVGNVDGLAGPAHVEVWDWQKPRAQFIAGVQGHKAILNRLHFHPSGWLVGGGGGSDGGVLAFWKVEQLTEVVKEKKEAAHKVKVDGHVHDLAFSADAAELYTAGHRKLEVWSFGG